MLFFNCITASRNQRDQYHADWRNEFLAEVRRLDSDKKCTCIDWDNAEHYFKLKFKAIDAALHYVAARI